MFAGLEDCIKFVAHFEFTEDEISFVRASLPPSCEVVARPLFYWIYRNLIPTDIAEMNCRE